VLPRAQEFYESPEETARIARAAFPKGSPYMRFRDELGPIYSSQQFASLFSSLGQPAEDPAQLALATIMQFAEGLSDRQAADAVRGRIDWKYALSLEMTDWIRCLCPQRVSRPLNRGKCRDASIRDHAQSLARTSTSQAKRPTTD
jgi:transposase